MSAHQKSLCFLLLGVLCAIPATGRAGTDDVQDFVGCLEGRTTSHQRLRPDEAGHCIIAWACAKEARASRGESFEACCRSAPDLLVGERLKGNFLDSLQNITTGVNAMLQSDGLSVDRFWAAFGVHPKQAARCAQAFLRVRTVQGAWDRLDAEEELNEACLLCALSPKFCAERSRSQAEARGHAHDRGDR